MNNELDSKNNKRGNAWKGGLPHCSVCGVELSNYNNKTCKKHKKLSEETKLKMRNKIVPEEIRKKISLSLKGKIPSNILRGDLSGSNHCFWKGENVGYRGLHNWVSRWKGKPSICEFCGKNGTGRNMHWANIDGRYRRVLEDWIRLCVNCHGKYDKERGLRKYNHGK